MYIGKRLKKLRKARGITLVNLAEKSGVQVATLSRMENLKMSGTIESHLKIARALGVNITQLYTDITKDEEKIDIKTSETQENIFVQSDKSSYKLLAHKAMPKKMMPVLLKIEPKGKTNTEQNQIGSEKFVFVLKGAIEAKINSKTYPLSEHDTLYFDASLQHYFINSKKSAAQIICVTTPAML